ncbi:hypothetical protein VMUT_1016 [Vulcanisaeta moutnovskia 768-28]|uniref:Uncharacterized protein n=1 Tax=Vulcanisaeta moutnovskia (strain 768-28) TaxID=985053 RepID=F0QXR0_VULM7|nr:hypothetical protein [Vulcanisaeta moutnovskia]ADY01223.1 hypothetical protein VMUT_1016 [Vulcanisaeta moutnovskia 768-28]
MSIKDGLRPLEDPNGRRTCINVGKDYGDWEVEFDVCIDLP